eukprot:s7135_g3.t1
MADRKLALHVEEATNVQSAGNRLFVVAQIDDGITSRTASVDEANGGDEDDVETATKQQGSLGGFSLAIPGEDQLALVTCLNLARQFVGQARSFAELFKRFVCRFHGASRLREQVAGGVANADDQLQEPEIAGEEGILWAVAMFHAHDRQPEPEHLPGLIENNKSPRLG